MAAALARGPTAWLRAWAALLCWGLCTSTLAQQPDDEMQGAFLEGARLMQVGAYNSAAAIFRGILVKTGSPRVKLELARALYLQKEYREARELFKEVLYDPATPWRVQDNIEAFIHAIEQAEGYLKFSLSMVSDSNPRNISSQREFSIGGLQLNYAPPPDSRPVTGLRYAVQAFQPTPAPRIAAYFTAAYLDFGGRSLDRLTFDAGATAGLDEAKRMHAKAGLEAGTFDNALLYRFPYVGGVGVLSQSSLHRITAELKTGRVIFPDYSYLDANYYSAGLTLVRAIDSGSAVSLNGTVERSSANERPYSYSGLSAGPSISWLVQGAALHVKSELSWSGRRYWARDPLFGEQRTDRKTRAELSVRSKQWRWMTYRPALVFSIERNSSSIDFYGYRKANVSIALE